ncbi:MAG: SCO family protein [Chitinophagia bacterium]|nr:SCO family protein [Chitinophagia bacterium]NCA29803.1 SCO family protein [Chitinophagia bacterium]NDD15420.1 SCO family protein [Chitinophagia bacterium]
MSKKSIFGLLIALVMPVACYLWLKSASDTAVIMPRHYLLDTVIEQVVDGKQKTDSIWHKTKNIELVNQLGDTVHLYDQQGKIIILDLFFTSCGSICPRLTNNMSKLQQSFTRGGDIRKKVDTSIVQFMSISVDPIRDSVPVLRAYANKTGVIADNWWLLTGNRDSIYNFAFEELKVDQFSQEPISPDFVHTSRFILIDKKMQIRGYYNGLDSASLLKLAKDVGYLMLEKDKTKKNKIFQDIIDLSWLWLVIALLVSSFVYYFNTKFNKKESSNA